MAKNKTKEGTAGRGSSRGDLNC